MSTVRINDDIKKEIAPILDNLGLSLSEAINIYLHQIKLNNGIPFDLKIKNTDSYVCEYGHLHDYSKLNLEELEEEAKNNKSYDNVEELIEDLEKED